MIIVLVEDEGITRLWTRELLSSWDYEVIDFPDGLEAFQYLDGLSQAYVAILDWQLPGMDGTAICQQLKADHDKGQLGYFIMLSGQSARSHQQTAAASGIDVFVAKPYQPNDLKTRVEQAVLELKQRRLPGLF